MAIQYETAPVATDAFSRMMLEPFADNKRRGTLFVGLFGGRNRYYFENDTIDIQIQRRGNRMAPMVIRGNGTEIGDNRKAAQPMGWTEVSRTFPMIEKHATLSADQLTKRVFTETVYNSGYTRQRRARILAADQIQQYEDAAAQTCEYNASFAFTNARQPKLLTETYATATYDYLRHSNGKKTYAADWATSTTSADADIDSACDFVIQRGNGKPDVMLIGDTKYAEWKALDEFAEIKNDRHKVNIRADFDVTAPSYLRWMEDAGADFQFMYKTGKGRKLAVFTYDHVYTDLDGNDTALLGTNDMIIFDSGARFETAWGPSDYFEQDRRKMQLYMDIFGIDIEAVGRTNATLPGNFNFSGFHYDAYPSGLDGKGIKLRVQAAPLYIPVQTDAICTTKESW